ncbi:lanC-like protein GCR2 isoform X2 [Corylus avellana]|uniref:lanC-like protein GCR2 isoform X2 n=1 Tax=Corylus avellana TaxID=13451 RepID=UPI00286CF7E0|nr:lanC-like protein GCR2 isoform X2 [Corylus avellana]
MADRFFPNEMPDFVAEAAEDESASGRAKDSLTRLLHLPYKSLSERLQKLALDLKEAVVRETWGLSAKRVHEYTLYTSALGTAYLLFKAFQVTQNENDLKLCSEIVKACDSASRDSGRVTFICGRAGICALGAVIANHSGDERLLERYLTKFKERPVVDDIIKAGRRLSSKGKCPLMYEWHGKRYWGAAHGLAGILHVLMHMELKPDEVEDVKGTLCYMIKNRYPSGNYPSSEGSESDHLVHWCHGAPGIALILVKAAEVYGGKEFLQAAVDAGDVVWNRGLLKRVGLCHGISGNTYVFLSLYRLTGNVEYLYRAKAFTCFLLDRAQKLISEGKMHGGDRPHSLFEGIGGMAHLFLDMTEPSDARFPAYEL